MMRLLVVKLLVYFGSAQVPTIWPTVAKNPTTAPDPHPVEVCNICGEGNKIGSPDSKFRYQNLQGVFREQGCQEVQNLIDIGLAPLEFCSLDFSGSYFPCECRTPSGQLVYQVLAPSLSPPPFCNICGDGNSIGQDGAIVPLIDHQGIYRPFPCSELQRLSNTPNVFPDGFCTSLYLQSLEPCGCVTPDGVLLTDIFYPTFSPANGGKPATPHAGNPTAPSSNPTMPNSSPNASPNSSAVTATPHTGNPTAPSSNPTMPNSSPKASPNSSAVTSKPHAGNPTAPSSNSTMPNSSPNASSTCSAVRFSLAAGMLSGGLFALLVV